ncbi:MAG: molybdopterin molybdotransferase MoeA [candidate division KSB1 bacterium]|nr:molybdopterin molybdotransferase MoeA [candidate division KSB1 bacterium]MDZ7275246.1 molybdopterin molybdotransferase MoeA [candidate division KSB1 bacterium]MDZ7287414.1 molybdopterin molybdotransferase MoeA [candidate division KSB1 bacterium]MDZ7299528.1 molybdopterin molybdotransferase MoeA [candidate division KSB1 bacterium]MDZ7305427.1 molybdopterin molybdotransferase MoeA [candidate division KSB1 bacterium]
MIPLQQAVELVMQNTGRLPAETVDLLQAAGRVLAEEIISDRDQPPFARSSMDGYALRAADVAPAPVQLQVVGFIPAGTFPDFQIQQGQAAKIMTGAPLPAGADSVQMIEKTRPAAGDRVEVLEAVPPGHNVSPQGSEAAAGQVVARAGSFVSPAVIGLLAAVGKSRVRVYRRPAVAIIATGDELVEIDQTPKLGQIRNSNSFALAAQVARLGATARLWGMARDQQQQIRELLQRGLACEVVVLTGGVSMGDLDLVEDVFQELGLQIHFNKVAVKPGKPVVFATCGDKLVFGLPGNPVSAATTFELLVRPAIRKLMGFSVYSNQIVAAQLEAPIINRSQREYYAPATAWYDGRQFRVRPLASKGSGDQVTYAQSNCYLICPREVVELHAGETVRVMLRPEFFSC